MNLLSQFEQVLDRQERGIARITGQRSDGQVVAQTQGGAILILKGEIETGKQCYYDRVSSQVIGVAPDVVFSEYGV